MLLMGGQGSGQLADVLHLMQCMRLNHLISRIHAAHAGWLQFVESTTELELERMGRHPIGQTLSVKQMIQMHALHQVQHIRDLASALPAH